MVALSEHYNAVLADRLTGTFGLSWERRERGEDEAQRDEGQVGDHQVHRTVDVLGREVADVEPLAHEDAGVGPDGRGQLVVAHVHGGHPFGAPLEEDLGEAAGGGPGVERPAAGHGDVRERLERADELVGRTGDVPRARVAQAQTAERSRIAREMHDIVAHTLAGITALADGARYASKHNPEVARDALETISAESRTALSQMRGLLSVLRDDDAAAPTGTAPGHRDFTALFNEARARGLDLSVVGFDELPEDVSPLTLFTLYRVCQEAITNMLRHAPAPEGALTFSADAKSVRVEAVNAAAKSKHGPDGFGLVGIRERVAAHGGRVNVTDDRGEFVLTAEVPR